MTNLRQRTLVEIEGKKYHQVGRQRPRDGQYVQVKEIFLGTKRQAERTKRSGANSKAASARRWHAHVRRLIEQYISTAEKLVVAPLTPDSYKGLSKQLQYADSAPYS